MLTKRTLLRVGITAAGIFPAWPSFAATLSYENSDSLIWQVDIAGMPRLPSPADWLEIGHVRGLPRALTGAIVLDRQDKASVALAELQALFAIRDGQTGFPYRPYGHSPTSGLRLARLLSTAFFMVELLQAVNAAATLPSGRSSRTTLMRLANVMRPEATEIAANVDEIMIDNLRAANRLMLLVRFLILANVTYGIEAPSSLAVYVRAVASLMTNQGYFLESGGGDVSYQAAGMLSANYALLAHRVPVLENLVKRGLPWLNARISPDGLLLMSDSSRTNGEDRMPDGKPKPPNFGEIACALAFGATLLDDPTMAAKARAVLKRPRPK